MTETQTKVFESELDLVENKYDDDDEELFQIKIEDFEFSGIKPLNLSLFWLII